MQKSKSLLLKILMVVMVLCCALCSIFSMAGCNEAANGKDGVNGVGIQKVEIVDGELVITFTNGTTQKAGAIGGVACEHSKTKFDDEFLLDGTNPDACKAKLYTCSDCGFVAAEYIAHTTTEVEGQESTCTEQGYGAGQKCTVKDCNWTSSEKEPLAPHKWDEDVTTIFDDKSGTDICTAGYTKLKVCTDCGTTEVVEHKEGVGHKGTLEKTSDNPTTAKEGKLTLDCEVCGATNVPVTIPKLSDTDYTIEVTATSQANETIAYTYSTDEYSVDGKAQEIAFEGSRLHSYAAGKEAASLIKDFDPAVIKEVKVMAGQTLNCASPVAAVYECVTCGDFVDVQVQKAHSMDPAITEEDIDADMKKEFACTSNKDAENTLKYDCFECKAQDAVSVTRPAFDHDITLKDGSTITLIKEGVNAGKYEILFDCKNHSGDLGEEATLYVNKDDPNLSIVDSTCTVKGSVTYTDTDGKKVTAELGLAHHVIAYKDETPVRVAIGADINFADYKDVNFVVVAGDPEIECGKTVKAMYVCEDCDVFVNVYVKRDHKFVETKIKAEGDCKNDRVVEFTCAYDDCDFADSKKDTEGFVWGTYTEKAQHKFELDSAAEDHTSIVVSCSVCDVDSITIDADNELAHEDVESNECGKSGDKYTFVYDGADYELFEANNNIHKFAGEYFDSTVKMFTKEQASPIAGQGEPDCAHPVKGIVICELCKSPVEVKVIGDHVLELDAETQLPKKYAATCTTPAYNKCTVADCSLDGIVAIASEPALGHKYALVEDEFDTTPASVTIKCEREGCKMATISVAVEVAEGKFVKDTKSFCDKTVYTYVDYKIGNDKFTIKFYVFDGSHEFIKDAEKEEIISVWTEVNGGTYYVAGKYCSKCGEMIVYARVDSTTDAGKAWKDENGAWKMSVIEAAVNA